MAKLDMLMEKTDAATDAVMEPPIVCYVNLLDAPVYIPEIED